MATLLASATVTEVPRNYMFPGGKVPSRWGKLDAPIIDLHEKNNLSQNIMKAIQDFGFFQVINHDVPIDLMKDAMGIFKDLYDLPQEEIAKINMKEDVNNYCSIYTSSVNYDREDVHYWRNCLRQCCHPLEECIKYWPKNPENYREVIKAYVLGLKNLRSKTLENIAEGLELEKTYFANAISEDCILYVNGFPACPDPTSTIGLAKHTDPSLITIVHSGRIPGLKIFKDDQWLSVETPEDAFLIFIGNMMQAVSNGKLQCTPHMVTNTREARISCAFFVNPEQDCIVEPSKELIARENMRPIYKSFTYKEFIDTFKNGSGDRDEVLEESFMLQHD